MGLDFFKKLINNVHIESKEFTYSIELLVKAKRLNFLIAEIPSQWAEEVVVKVISN